MLRGTKVGLRARHDDDIPVLTELYNDVENAARANGAPWRPVSSESKDPRLAIEQSEDRLVRFSAVELQEGTLLGSAALWGIDTHHRSAHIGLDLLPACRGQGYGTDVVAALCFYAFTVRGLNRLQIETVADNHAMLRAAENNGFVREGVLRSAVWVLGQFLDEVVLGLVAEDWRARG